MLKVNMCTVTDDLHVIILIYIHNFITDSGGGKVG